MPIDLDNLPRPGDDPDALAAHALGLVGTAEGRILAQELAGTDAGLRLTQTLALTGDGQRLSQELARAVGCGGLADQLAGTSEGMRLIVELAGTDEGRRLVLDLAGTEEGRRLAIDLVSTGRGRRLARELTTKARVRRAAQDLADTESGRRLALELADTAEAPRLALELAAAEGSGTIAWELIRTGPSHRRELAVDLGRSAVADGLTAAIGNGIPVRDPGALRELLQVSRELTATAQGRRFIRDIGANGTDRSDDEALNEATARIFGAGAVVTGGVAGLLGIAAAVIFAAGAATLRVDTPDRDGGEVVEAPGKPPVSVGELVDLEVVGRLTPDQADRLRGRLEPILGRVEQLLADDRFHPQETADQVEQDLRRLRDELYGDVPVEPLGPAVRAYFASLLEATLPQLDREDLHRDAGERGVDPDRLDAMVDRAVDQATHHGGSELNDAIEIADLVQELAPDDLPAGRRRAEWAATMVGWATDTSLAAGGGVGAGTAVQATLNLTWLSPVWAAVIGGIVGIVGVIARNARDGLGD